MAVHHLWAMQRWACLLHTQPGPTLPLNHSNPLSRWGIQKGFVSLPKSTVPARQEVNLNVFSITIPDDDMATLDGLEADFVTGWDPIRDAPV